MTITGRSAEVKHGYYAAATLQQWTFIGDRAGGTVTATVHVADAFRMTQRPLEVVAEIGRDRCRWPILAMQCDGVAFTATVGAKE